MAFTRKRQQTSSVSATKLRRPSSPQKIKSPKESTAVDEMELDAETSTPPEQTTKVSAAVFAAPLELESEPDVAAESGTPLATNAAEVLNATSGTRSGSKDAELPYNVASEAHGTNATNGEELINAGEETPDLNRPPTIPIQQEDSSIHSIDGHSNPPGSHGENQPDGQQISEEGKKDDTRDNAKDGCEAGPTEKPAPASRPSETRKSPTPVALPLIGSNASSSSTVAEQNAVKQGGTSSPTLKRKSLHHHVMPFNLQDGNDPSTPIVIIDNSCPRPRRKQKKLLQVSREDLLEGESMRRNETKEFMDIALRLERKLLEHDKEDERRAKRRRQLQTKAVQAVRNAIAHNGLESIGTT